jgi:hypothetical protein
MIADMIKAILWIAYMTWAIRFGLVAMRKLREVMLTTVTHATRGLRSCLHRP